MFTIDSACGYGFAPVSGCILLPGEELGADDGDLDFRLELGMERCWLMFRTFADAQSTILFLPDLPLLPLDIV